ncbi:hypothetical protein [Streptomyces sp. SID161]|uniref:hypothetical protein n=1 Tax=Streptomyces sp. SID161 TaxID=2690251 RepID=UPI00136898C4|nr:hypothetical protein [Streptomyces sp. SID161]MYW48842.1 hypothetical protein [Streptomyces sp. SID161]MYW49873.1 hypothetical protein [Streptomyces sp. SID161]
MSAYSTAYQALTTGRALRPHEAAKVLSDLQRETGEELANAVEQQLDGKFRRTDTDTDGAFRKKRLHYGASMRVINAFRVLAQAPRPTTPNSPTRSTS